MRLFVSELRRWPARRWWFAAGMAAATYLFIALPTDLIDNPLFGRDVPPTWWSRGALLVSSILAGLVAATYVAGPDAAPRRREGRLGMAGGIATFFAVGCPVCNKLVLLALGYSGAIQYFAPIQPYLAVGAVGLLGWAFVARVRRENSCRIPSRVRVPSDA
jgi:hypothetical protein